MPKNKFNERGENANNKKHFLETGEPKVSEDGSINIEAEMSYVQSRAYKTYGVKDIVSESKNDSPLPTQK